MAKKNAAKKMEIVSGADVPTYYVNSIKTELSTFDVRFRMGQIQSADENTVQVKEVVYVFMSHAHFKEFVEGALVSVAKLDNLLLQKII